MKTAFLLGYIAVMIFAFYKKGWKSWIPWFFCIVVFYHYETFFSNSKASSLALNVAEPVSEVKEQVVQETENTRDGVYILNGKSDEATLTIMGDDWFYEFDSDNMPYLNSMESGTISGGVLYYDIVVRRGYFIDDKIIYQGYQFIKVLD